MIDEKRIRLMTKISVYEKGEGLKDFKMNRYSERTYVNMKVLGSSIAVTLAFLLGVFLYSFHFYSEISTRGFSFPYRTYLIYVVAVYVAVFLIHFILARRYYRKRYEKMRNNLDQYDRDLYILKQDIQKAKNQNEQA